MEGEYDTALAYYNKGFKQRPDIQAFQDGIFKSQDAMNRGLGSGNDPNLIVNTFHVIIL